MLERVVFFVAGLFLIGVTRSTFADVLKYYLKPGLSELKLRFASVAGFNKVLVILLLHFGITFLILALVPDSAATSASEIPETVWDALNTFSMVAFLEELLFRVLPWIPLFKIRRAARGIWAERANVVLAVGVSLVFGLLHVTNFDSPDIWTYVRTLSQFSGGILYWYLMEKYGLVFPAVAHFLFNMTAWVLCLLGGSF